MQICTKVSPEEVYECVKGGLDDKAEEAELALGNEHCLAVAQGRTGKAQLLFPVSLSEIFFCERITPPKLIVNRFKNGLKTYPEKKN